MAQKWRFVWLLWTLISQAWNGLLRHFQCPKSSAGNSLAVEKGPGSFAPLWAELWPFKEGNRQFYLVNLLKGLKGCRYLELKTWILLWVVYLPIPIKGVTVPFFIVKSAHRPKNMTSPKKVKNKNKHYLLSSSHRTLTILCRAVGACILHLIRSKQTCLK